MIIIACILFVITGFFGVLNLLAILKNKSTKGPIILVHGMVALFALFALTAYTVLHPNPLLIGSIVLFLLAALGGIILLGIDMSNKPIPKVIALMHPLVALIGFVLLLTYVYQAFVA